jgi:hypothetical protein
MRLEGVDHPLIGGENVQPGKQRGISQEFAIRADRIIHAQAVARADHIVFLTVGGGGMHRAGAGFGGDVIAENDRHFAVIERMAQRQPFQIAAQTMREDLIMLDLPAGQRIFQQRLRRPAAVPDPGQSRPGPPNIPAPD